MTWWLAVLSRSRAIGRTFSTAAWWTLAIAGVVIVLLIWGSLVAQHRARTAAATAAAAGQISAAQTGAARDAIGIQDQALNAATNATDLTRESTDVIQHAQGADQRLDPDLNRTGRERLCLREAYRHRPECLQQSGGTNAPR